MNLLYLTEEEKDLLRQYFKSSPIGLIRHKAQTVIMRDKGMKIKDIAASLFRSERTITRWITDYTQRRMASIFSGLANNENASKLTHRQKEEIRQTLKKPPSDQGLPKEFWDVPQLKKYVKAVFGVVYESTRSYHYLLQFSNLTFKQPDIFDVKRDEKYIEQRLFQIRKEIIPLMRNPDWAVLVSDETRIMLEAITRRAWLRKGEKTVLKVERSSDSQYYAGFLNLKTGRDHLYALKWGNQKELIKALEHLVHKVYPDKLICIVWDNVSFHKGKMIKKRLKKGGSLERVYLINFPPYAPDTNPQEAVWNSAKKYISNRQFRTFTSTKRSFRHYISTKIFNYTI
jgi:transposase